MALVFIPIPMRALTAGVERVTVPGASVGQIVDNLESLYPGIRAFLVEDSEVHPAISVAVDGDIVPRSLLCPVSDTSEVHFLPALAGG